MKIVEKSGKTIDEAIDLALKELGVSKDEVDIEIIDEPNKGFFGLLGSKMAKVKVYLKENPMDKVKKFLKDIFIAMDLDVNIETFKKEDYNFINLTGPDLGILIGRRGDTLDALQYIVNLVANKNVPERIKIIIDVEGYRARREETLKKLALRCADKAIKKGRDIVLEPMNPHERRIIHTTLQNNEFVTTFSEGEEPYRKIIITPKGS